MTNQKELQEKILAYRILQARLESIIKQRDLIVNKMVELQNTLATIDEVKKTEEETLFPLGSEAYVFGKPTNREKLIVEIGANVALEKTFEEGKKILSKRKDELEKTLAEIQKEISQLSSAIQELTPKIQDMIEKSQQAG